jgi:hypothetical protein
MSPACAVSSPFQGDFTMSLMLPRPKDREMKTQLSPGAAQSGGTVESFTMSQSLQNVGMLETVSELRNDLFQIEKRIEALRESIRTAENELLRMNGQLLAVHEDTLVARIADDVFSRLAATSRDTTQERKQYLREKEAALYMASAFQPCAVSCVRL